MAEVLALLGEILVRVVFQAIGEGIVYGLARFWFWLTGQGHKAEVTVHRHGIAREARRKNIERIRRKRKKAG